MDPESKKLIEETYALEEENNKMLHSLKRSMFWSRTMSIAYWVLIIGVSVGAFYYIQPYLDDAMSIYGDVKNNLENVGSFFKNTEN
jgi:hypothetical protein